MSDFSKAHAKLLTERNTNIEHLITNIRKDPRFEKMLMRIAFYGESRRFNLDNEVISELATYGIIGADENGICQILNPIYLHRVLQAFQPPINGLEDEYFTENGPMDFTEYLTPEGHIQMNTLLGKFQELHRTCRIQNSTGPRHTPRIRRAILALYLSGRIRQNCRGCDAFRSPNRQRQSRPYYWA